jgi:alpha-tubulin suppressor-like RCC1 family protein
MQYPCRLGKVIDLCCGYGHVAALTESEAMVCWGNNDYVQCNLPNDLQVMIPQMEPASFPQPPRVALPQQAELERFQQQHLPCEVSNIEVCYCMCLLRVHIDF